MPTISKTNKKETITHRKCYPMSNAESVVEPVCDISPIEQTPCRPTYRINGKDIIAGSITKEHLAYDLVCETPASLTSIRARNAFVGMLVSVISENAVYMLTKAPLNIRDNWKKVSGDLDLYLTKKEFNASAMDISTLKEICK